MQSNFPDILVSDYEFFKSDKDLLESINSYISISNIELDKFKNLYGNLDFLIGNIFLKKWIEKNIYSSIIETVDYINQIKGDTFNFLASSGNVVYCLEKIIELNGFIFSKESCENGNTMVYNRVHKDISENIERFRCKIFKQKFKKITNQQIVFMEINMKMNVKI